MTNLINRELVAEIGKSLLFSISDRGFKGLLVGLKWGEYIIVEIPRIAEIDPLLIEGKKIAGAFLVSGSVVKFEATINAYFRRPARLLIASWPLFFKSRDLRKTHRVDCNIPCVLKSSHKMHEHHGLIRDISTGGCRFHTKSLSSNEAEILVSEKAVVIEFELPGGNRTDQVNGEIMSTRREGGAYILGIRFRDNEKEVIDDINQYVTSIMEILP